jgi:hypothetical protein
MSFSRRDLLCGVNLLENAHLEDHEGDGKITLRLLLRR